MTKEKIIHDFLLDNRPEGSEHSVDDCVHCVEKASHDKEEEGMADATITQEAHEALLESAVAKAKAETNDAVRAEVDAEVLALNGELATANEKIESLEAELATLRKDIEDREEAARIEALAVERVELVKAVASFSDEQIEKRRNDWASMSEDSFGSYIEDLRAVASKPKDNKGGEKKHEIDGTRETASEEGYAVSGIFAIAL